MISRFLSCEISSRSDPVLGHERGLLRGLRHALDDLHALERLLDEVVRAPRIASTAVSTVP
jgi:hypothetical protein